MVALVNIDAAFGQPALTEAVRTLETSATDGKFRALYREGRQEFQVPGETATFDEIRSSRGLAPITGLLSPTPQQQNTVVIPRQQKMFRVAEKRFIPWTKLFINRAGGELRDNARAVVRQEQADMLLEMGKTLELSHGKSLQGTAGFVGSAANVPGTDYPVTVAYPVQTANKVASWADPATKIISSELPAVQAAMISNCGRAAGRGIINDATYGYMLGNTEIATRCVNSRELAEAFLRASVAGTKVLDGIMLGELSWTVNGYGYVPAGGAFTRWMASDRAIFLPQDIKNVLGTLVGRQAIPTKDVIGRVDGDFPELEYGLVSWAKWLDEPVGLEIYTSWYGAPVVYEPQAVLYLTLV